MLRRVSWATYIGTSVTQSVVASRAVTGTSRTGDSLMVNISR
jgi:hypothetical protein